MIRRRKKKAHHGGGDSGGGRWLVSYADFVTLMFGFFLILWASADQNQEKYSQLALAFQRAFNTGPMLAQQGTGQIIGTGGRVGTLEIAPIAKISENAGEIAEQMGLLEDISVGTRKEGLAITLSGSLLFSSGTADLRLEAVDVLARIATLLESSQGDIEIEGHTDNIPISTPQFPSNWELSARRSAAVLRFFTEQLGMNPERFQIAGYGDTRPLFPNDSRENRNKNRRVEILLKTQPDPMLTAPGGSAGAVAKPGATTNPVEKPAAARTAPAAPAAAAPAKH